jgi:hypothetical protein
MFPALFATCFVNFRPIARAQVRNGGTPGRFQSAVGGNTEDLLGTAGLKRTFAGV